MLSAGFAATCKILGGSMVVNLLMLGAGLVDVGIVLNTAVCGYLCVESWQFCFAYSD